MNRTKLIKRDLLVFGRLVTVFLLTALPASSFGQQEIRQLSPVQIDKQQKEQKAQPVEQQPKVMKQQQQVIVPRQIDPQRSSSLKLQLLIHQIKCLSDEQ